jgi:hypothetical protein
MSYWNYFIVIIIWTTNNKEISIKKNFAKDLEGNRTRAAQTRGEHYSRTSRNSEINPTRNK